VVLVVYSLDGTELLGISDAPIAFVSTDAVRSGAAASPRLATRCASQALIHAANLDYLILVPHVLGEKAFILAQSRYRAAQASCAQGAQGDGDDLAPHLRVLAAARCIARVRRA
jgi:hypothetical protein